MPNCLRNWQRIRQELKMGENLSQLERVTAIERFSQQLENLCGEDPTVLMTLGTPVCSSDDLVEVPLSDYFGWFLKARHGAVYQFQEDLFRCVAHFGSSPNQIFQLAFLPHWLAVNGVLVRSKLTLTGLTAQESEILLNELDALDAYLVVPITMNEKLWGFFAIGSPLTGDYGESESLYLSLHGLSIISCLDRKQEGLLPQMEMKRREEDKAFLEVMALWIALKPTQNRVRLLLLDEELDVVKSLSSFFREWDFEVIGTTNQEEAIDSLASFRPHLILADLNLNQCLPTQFLESARFLAPHAILLGTTTFLEGKWDPTFGLGMAQIFRKPCRFARLGKGVFEAALNISFKVNAETQFASNPSRMERCLIVDDEQEATEALRDYFRTKGFHTWSATTGAEALKLISEVNPHLILLDLKLPDAKGVDLIRQIRDISPTSRLIVLTAVFQEYSDKTHKSLRPDAYALKPISVSELNQLMENVLVESVHA